MSTAAVRSDAGRVAVRLQPGDDFDGWRVAARNLVQAGIEPDRVDWQVDDEAGSLFGSASLAELTALAPARPARASKAFVQAAQFAICHSSSARLDLMYRLLWRLQDNPRLLEDGADRDVRELDRLARAVRRDMHKMRAFVRFREVDEPSGGVRYVAWFEPDHSILRANAGFFVRRFATMRWSILTPRGALHWDGDTLHEGPPAQRGDAPGADPTEDLWRRYYASIFNPARLKVGAMLKEMPKKYWKNMPEAALIPELVAGAQGREAAMVAVGEANRGQAPRSLAEVATGIAGCRQCPIGCLENRAVAGEGSARSTLMIVGEQPGDHEDLAGRPFVGPAGGVLDRHLAQAGIDRAAAYVTNAVKHFKFTRQSARRLHQSPSPREVDHCRWWLDSERAIVQPRLVLALGASAARGLLGKTVSVAKVRGQPIPLDDGSELWVTVHPSYLLRLDGEAQAEQERLFAADLVAVRNRLGAVNESRVISG